MTQPIKATKGDEVHLFPSVRQCMKYLEVTPNTISRALAFGLDVKGWMLEKVTPATVTKAVLHTDSVIATTQKGVHIKFRSIIQASKILQCNPNAIRDAMKGKDRRYGSWSWSIDNGDLECLEPSDLLCSSFCLRGGAGRKPNEREEVEEDEEDIMEVDPYEGREVVATGVYDIDYGPTICPFCNNVILHDTREGDFSGYKHLTSCLAGHDWSVQYGIVKVYK